MEPREIFISEEWSSLSGFYTAQEAEFMAQFYENCSSVPEDLHGNANLLGFQSSYAHFSGDSFYLPSNVADDPTNNNFGSIAMCCEVQDSEPAEENDDDDKTSNLERKRSMSSAEIQKNKRNVKPRRKPNPKCFKSNKEEDRSNNDDGLKSRSFFSSSEDDSIIASSNQEDDTNPKKNTDLKSNSKSRSDTGPNTDSQSLYARRRRLRINEKLRILQNLVPNGTKVNISTMLEEAVQYVKFLQLQIKLLRSYDLWMYAPIAFNGLNIGLDLNITPTRQP